MRVIKFILVFLALITIICAGAWFYVTTKLTNIINDNYSKKPIKIKDFKKLDYYISFDNASSTGFPYKISWNINNFTEESKAAKLTYSEPIQIGYNLLSQEIFVNYTGTINANFKPTSHGFGSKININNYNISIRLPLSKQLISDLKNLKDPAILVNYFDSIKASTDNVEISDLVDNIKFYQKDYENLSVKFVPTKYYENTEDLLNNVPSQYFVNYSVKTNSLSEVRRRIPVSLFYGFFMMPAGLKIDVNANIKTSAKKFAEINENLELDAKTDLYAGKIDLTNINFYYKKSNKNKNLSSILNLSTDINVRDGFFDELFDDYINMNLSNFLNNPIGSYLDQELRYVIKHKEDFKFKNLENSNYKFYAKLNNDKTREKSYIRIEDLSLMSDKSGIKLKHDQELEYGNNKSWKLKGVLYVNNYPAVIDFTSGYVYRFGKFRFLNDQARDLYIAVNKQFFKDISDYPKSLSEDLSFEYDITSNKMAEAKFGNSKLLEIPQLYTLLLYQKLIEKVSPTGDIIQKMKEILPDIKEDDNILQKLLPKKDFPSSPKIIPKDAKEALNKIIPKDKIENNLIKNLLN